MPHPLYAKLYLVLRSDPITPLVGYFGSTNLTLAGLSRQGELNVDVVEQDAAHKLQQWFNERWQDRLAFDISEQLAALQSAGQWNPSADAKLDALYETLSRKHRCDKMLVFTQFADTALYLKQHLQARGLRLIV